MLPIRRTSRWNSRISQLIGGCISRIKFVLVISINENIRICRIRRCVCNGHALSCSRRKRITVKDKRCCIKLCRSCRSGASWCCRRAHSIKSAGLRSGIGCVTGTCRRRCCAKSSRNGNTLCRSWRYHHCKQLLEHLPSKSNWYLNLIAFYTAIPQRPIKCG